MLTADRAIALAIIGLSLYFMSHAIALPIGWNGETGGPGGGAFPFWLSLIMALCAAGVLIRSFGTPDDGLPFFDPETIRSVAAVAIALTATIALTPILGAYVSIVLFLLWYLRVFGGHGWTLTLSLTAATPLFLFFFFEVTLKILLPKGWTEPLFLPLYATFF
ncbi:tripartite tricarboxylate transporter TctB family protein [Alphaproteobacteria bacterium GH1-50]|uniref:Tripartite tricarboxylate transporter TctB family protein n=1 Tax=Kangsaoukella pontilimi TaxID=2691042 RepID=A0A7C9IGG3_9RHOB|nr:tripartite tricarboxylate transporter TctB family protein [Kangsaoukella pontilimi]MXQ08049.1 tripartite tricarboxylate transporter TctB family protein [Kangsaoukella pontilimi]